jgi:pimeloyl-ACP methyl ester carboxylesterase
MSQLLQAAPAPEWTVVDWSSHVRDLTVDGRRMRCVDLGGGPGPPLVLVLVHGTGGSWQTWLLNLGELARERRVIAIDLPGFGGSQPLAITAGMGAYADALAGLLEALAVERAVVVGHSLGGLVALRLALRHPALVAGVVSVDGGGMALSGLRLRLVTAALLSINALLSVPSLLRPLMLRPRARRLLVSGAMHDRAALTAELASEMLSNFAAPGLVPAVAAGARDDLEKHVGDIACPVLLLWGRHDRLLPVALADALAQRMRSARVTVIEGAGHCPMIERPHEFNRAVAEFADALD